MARFRVLMVLLAASVVCLTGCVRLHIDYDIQGHDRVDMTIDVAVRNADGEFPVELCSTDPEYGLVDVGDTVTHYSEDGPDGYTGCRILVTGTMYEMSGGDVTLWAENGEWEFHQAPGFMEASGYNERDVRDWVSDYRISVTLPERVYTHNGSSTVSESTVTWLDPADAFHPDGLRATGNDTAGRVASLIVSLTTIVLVVAVIVAAVVMVRRNKAKIAAAEAQQQGAWPQPPYGAGAYPPPQSGTQQPPAPRQAPRGWPYEPDSATQTPPRRSELDQPPSHDQ